MHFFRIFFYLKQREQLFKKKKGINKDIPSFILILKHEKYVQVYGVFMLKPIEICYASRFFESCAIMDRIPLLFVKFCKYNSNTVKYKQMTDSDVLGNVTLFYKFRRILCVERYGSILSFF